jgi:2-C-methyl-D-erythritol 4-phosphate cytidylyltransferase
MDELRAAAIVLAAGSGSRLGSDVPKALVKVAGVPMVTRAVRAATAVADLVVVAAPAGEEEPVRGALDGGQGVSVVTGGPTRHASVRAALERIPPDRELIIVHDAARPFATPGLFESVIAALVAGVDGVVPVVAISDTIKRVRGGTVVATEDRAELGLAQTPQAFRASVLREAHADAAAAGVDLTDDAAVLERAGRRVVVVAGEPGNFKITTQADLERAGAGE